MEEKYLSTNEFARELGVTPFAIYKEHSRCGAYFTAVPLKAMNGRLRWPASAVMELKGVCAKSVQFDVKGNYPGGTLFRGIVTSKGAESYRLFWEGIYEARTGSFPPYGEFTDLMGVFKSEAAAVDAFNKLREDIIMVEQ